MKLCRILTATTMAAGLVCAPFALPAWAQDDLRPGPLVGAPAIRNRIELRDKRFELGAGLGSSIAAEFFHAFLLNIKLGYHLNDWLAISGTFSQNLTPKLQTGYTENLLRTLPTRISDPTSTRDRTRAEVAGGLNRMEQLLGLQAELTPISGKFAMFGKLFFGYDVYAFGGLGMVNLTADRDPCTSPIQDASCPYTGFKMGGTFGLGMHTFINEWFAVNLEVRDFFLKNNGSGRDVNADRLSNDRDLTWQNHFVWTANAQFFLPRVARRSD